MINDFNDFCTWMYVVVDDIGLKITPFFKRPGPAPECPDSELLAMALIGEYRGWDMETEMLSHWQEHRDLFPVIPTQSRFNRRRRGLMQAFNLIAKQPSNVWMSLKIGSVSLTACLYLWFSFIWYRRHHRLLT